jgi:hypothetical protein
MTKLSASDDCPHLGEPGSSSSRSSGSPSCRSGSNRRACPDRPILGAVSVWRLDRGKPTRPEFLMRPELSARNDLHRPAVGGVFRARTLPLLYVGTSGRGEPRLI